MPANAPNALALMIYDCKCACGNQWTHSVTMLYGNGYIGGTPNAKEEAALPLAKAFLHPQRTYAHCSRCLSAQVPCQLPSFAGASTRASGPKARAKAATLAQLEGDIFP